MFLPFGGENFVLSRSDESWLLFFSEESRNRHKAYDRPLLTFAILQFPPFHHRLHPIRAPYGDVDNRVRMIAAEVFGLRTVQWNQDSADWAIGGQGSTYTVQNVEATMNGWLTGSKNAGLVMLEHELNPSTVQVFMDMYPKMISNGWKLANVVSGPLLIFRLVRSISHHVLTHTP